MVLSTLRRRASSPTRQWSSNGVELFNCSERQPLRLLPPNAFLWWYLPFQGDREPRSKHQRGWVSPDPVIPAASPRRRIPQRPGFPTCTRRPHIWCWPIHCSSRNPRRGWIHIPGGEFCWHGACWKERSWRCLFEPPKPRSSLCGGLQLHGRDEEEGVSSIALFSSPIVFAYIMCSALLCVLLICFVAGDACACFNVVCLFAPY
jgi:hypothetical protein